MKSIPKNKSAQAARPFNTSLCGRADLLRALQHQDPALLTEMAELLGLERRPQKPISLLAAGSVSFQETGFIEEKPSANPKIFDSDIESIPFWRVTACKHSQEALHKEASSETITSLPARSQTQEPQKTAPPLATWPQLQPYLRREGMMRGAGKRVDIARTLRRLARGDILQSLPRLPQASWGQSLQIIIDRSSRLTPYWQDQLQLLSWLRRLFPRNGVEIALYWDGMCEPLRDSRHADRRYRPPAAGTLVLVLGDLGCFADAATQQIWRDLGQRLVHAECRPLALLPTAKNRQIAPWQTLAWERGKRNQGDLNRLFTLLSPAVRIEPGLLREMRREQNWDAAIEAAFWQHGDLSSCSSVAATLDTHKLKAQRQQFDALPEASRREALEILHSWRRALPFEIWIEEFMLNPSVYQLLKDQPDLQQDFQDGSALLRYYGQQANAPSGGLLPWFRRVHSRSADSYQGLREDIRPALDRLWHAAHPQSSQAPAGYNPAHISAAPEQDLRTLQVLQQSEQLHFIEASDAGQIEAQGSWLGTLYTRNQQISLTPIEKSDFWESGKPPPWAVDWGADEYGLWAELEYKGIRQRLRWIEPGTFMMGSPEDEAERDDDEHQHQVTLSQGYWLFDTAVTQALWQAVMGANPSHFHGADKPVEQVSWDDAQDFIQQLNQQIPSLVLCLPSEAQWEYACRAGTQTPFSFGDNITPEQVNYDGNYPYKNTAKGLYREETVAVKAVPCNAWGLYQMHGNVWEWCEDTFTEDYYYSETASLDPHGRDSGSDHIARGGSWNSGALLVRAAYRDRGEPDFCHDDLGFRCALVQHEHRPVSAKSGTAAATTRQQSSPSAAAVLHWQAQTANRLTLPAQQSFTLCSDSSELQITADTRPTWASNMGRDRYGLWAELEILVPLGRFLWGKDPWGKTVTQRLRWIPPGQFLMGSPETEKDRYKDEGPQHQVTLTQGFWLFDTAVTQDLWRAVMGNNPSYFEGEDRPVEQVSWGDCQEFIETFNQRFPIPHLRLSLPTEAQWEYACRAGTQTPFSFGDNITPDLVNYDGNGLYEKVENALYRAETVPVKMLPCNSWGLYQMHGNVHEWCTDYFKQSDKFGLNIESRRVFRGGSWLDFIQNAHAAFRYGYDSSKRFNYIGFRCTLVPA